MNATLEIKEQHNHKKYKAYFVGVSELQKKEFKDANCVMIISVGQKYHEYGEFQASIKLINKSFGYCNILVCDTLQRHTIKIAQQDKTENELYILSKSLGDQWVDRNMEYILSLDIPYTISRWDDWITHENFKFYHRKVENLYHKDAVYKDVVDQIAGEFLLRRTGLDIKDHKMAFDLCVKYLIEESAVACLWVECGYKFDVYPTRSNLAMIMAYNLLLDNTTIGASSLMLNIKKVNSENIKNLKTEEYKTITTKYLLSHAPGHIYWKNRDGVFLGSNVEHAKYFGFTDPNDIVGKVNSDFLDEENAAYITNIDNQVMQSGQEYIIEESINGNQFFLSKKIPLRDADNNIVGLLGTSFNITEQKALKLDLQNTVNKLKKALESKDLFIKNVNHEIRTPMQLILNGTRILKDNLNTFTEKEKHFFLDGMIMATDRLNDLVNNLLDMSKFQEGKFVLILNKEDFNILIKELVQEFSLIYGNRIEYEDLTNNIEQVVCDKIRIQQVLRNLLMNSIRYSKELTPITISSSSYYDNGMRYIKCTIKDEGTGIPTEEKYTVFEPFVGGKTTRNIPGGVGLGLSISKEIIQSHKGKIWVDNLTENEIGTRISFIIPFN